MPVIHGGLPLRAPQQTTAQANAPTCLTPPAAGLDSGSEEMWACVPANRDPQPARRFGTFPPDLYALAAWLAACHIETVAMESTGV